MPSEVRIAAYLAGLAAAAGGRPVMLGEVGFDPRDGGGGNAARRDFITRVGRWSGRIGLAGGFIWAYGRAADQSFGLGPGDPESTWLLQQWRKLL
ncbi:hypothetical protein SAMN06264364_14913 [Quadrisphaera granulorum]|uniref:Uncharacterized protein n=1 Tax=Quadrisphaera granulorum TaxID=317664 RepID=A0A316A911_9ACTN|nr:hypothetical protein [Quadrisphaera granulorum]PWJ46277.1 hypothetical protein BXY45_14913 [Quadrisphaera granulorum]SZE99092.1 hypothetical protein SAMN06264364_14913 [Quadrisphaera granulorum]